MSDPFDKLSEPKRLSVGSAIQKAGDAIASGAQRVRNAAMTDAAKASYSQYTQAIKSNVSKLNAAASSNDKVRESYKVEGHIASAKSTLQGVRSNIDMFAVRAADAVAGVGAKISKKGDAVVGSAMKEQEAKRQQALVSAQNEAKATAGVNQARGYIDAGFAAADAIASVTNLLSGQKPPAPTSVVGENIVTGLAAAAKSIAARGQSVGERLVKGSNGLNKPHPVVKDKGSSENSTPEGKPRGFQNHRNQAAAQRAKGNTYSGPSD
jgi:hypothetical protein